MCKVYLFFILICSLFTQPVFADDDFKYELDVLVTYAEDLSDHYPDFKDMILTQIEAANIAFERSDVQLHLNVVGIAPLMHSDFGSHRSNADILEGMKRHKNTLMRVRRQHHYAYVVVHYVAGNDNKQAQGGIGYILFNLPYVDEITPELVHHQVHGLNMYSVVRLSPSIEKRGDGFRLRHNLMTTAHEIGHNLGLYHDRRTLQRDGEYSTRLPEMKAHGFGLDNGAHSIMAYGSMYKDVLPLYRFSTPSVRYKGRALGEGSLANSVEYLQELIPMLPRIRSVKTSEIEARYAQTNIRKKTEHLMSIHKQMVASNRGILFRTNVQRLWQDYQNEPFDIEYYPLTSEQLQQDHELVVSVYSDLVYLSHIRNMPLVVVKVHNASKTEIVVEISGGSSLGRYQLYSMSNGVSVERAEHDSHLFVVRTHQFGEFALLAVREGDDFFQPLEMPFSLNVSPAEY